MSIADNIFERASREQLRFATSKGPLSVEDLWGLPLTSGVGRANLDDIAKGFFRELKSDNDVSFVTPSQKSNPIVQLSFDIVKHIIDVRVAENNSAREASDRAEKKQKLLAIMAEKEDESLKGMSLDDLRTAIAQL